MLGRSSCDLSCYLNFVSRIRCTSYLLIDHELGDREDTDRFAMPQGMLTPTMSAIRRTMFFGVSHAQTVVLRHRTLRNLLDKAFLNEKNHLGFQKATTCVNSLGAQEPCCQNMEA